MRTRNILPAIVLATAATGLLGPSCNPPQSVPTPPASATQYKPFRAEGRWIRDAEGRAVFLRGINYSHLSKTRPFTSWMKAEHFDRIASLGYNSVRLLVIWEALEPVEGQYDEAYLRKLEEVVGWCEQRGIWVILDMHQDLWAQPFGGDGAPPWMTRDDLVHPNAHLEPWSMNYFTTEVMYNFDQLWQVEANQAKFRKAWMTVVRRLHRNRIIAGYDLFNEPAPGSYRPDLFENDLLKPFYSKLVAEIRTVDPDRMIWIEPAVQTSTGLPSFLNKPFAERNLAYAVHFYDPIIQLGFGYQGKVPAALGYTRCQAEATLLEMPLVIGEWGTFLDHRQAKDYIRDQSELHEELMIPGALLWNFDPDPGSSTTLEKDRFDPYEADGSERDSVPHIDRPYPRLVAGTPTSFGFEISTRTFRLEWENSGVAAGKPTTIYLPARHYPNGFEVASSDPAGTWSWTYDSSKRTLDVLHDAGSQRHRVKITPR